ncbi:unnamed protein product [Adineta ricciae]|uniref:Uncharacterized protein n=1 Tax=Adineta ricciae TaxID=249248 RepID=A0A815IFC2_ADIRI|nr:unnamed protein product [Adineta ricciae]CAF1598148.1 unnamed protein product [Adineta ricciae]
MAIDRLRIVYQYLVKLNLYENGTSDEHEKRNEILSTKIYIILLVLVLLLYISYASLTAQANDFTISKPTQKQYERLELQYSVSLKCPCQELSIAYKRFIDIKLEYNEICSSDFVTQKWIDYLFEERLGFYHPLDFRRSAPFKFQLLRTLCQQSQRTIENNLEEFYSNYLISNEIISQDEFNAQVNYSVESFQKATMSSFQKLIKLIQEVTCANLLITAVETRYVPIVNNNDAYYVAICYKTETGPKTLVCSADYVLSEGIYYFTNYYDYSECGNENGMDLEHIPIFRVPGMFAGGLPIQSLMHSTLECLFDQLCLDEIGFYMKNSFSKGNFSRLKKDFSTKNRTIYELTKKLFVKNWNIIQSYEKYFSNCQILYCQYSDEQRNSFVYIFTTTISLFGGLKLSLPWIILYLLRFFRKKKAPELPTDTPTSKLTIAIEYIRTNTSRVVTGTSRQKFCLIFILMVPVKTVKKSDFLKLKAQFHIGEPERSAQVTMSTGKLSSIFIEHIN